nr:hypothetical protein [Klebsiella quasipneumoniae]
MKKPAHGLRYSLAKSANELNRESDPTTQHKLDLFIDGRLLFAKLNMLWWLYWSSIAAIDPDFAEVM